MFSSFSLMVFLTFCFIELRAFALAWEDFLDAVFSSLRALSTSAGRAVKAARN